jgi:hypothetical protein
MMARRVVGVAATTAVVAGTAGAVRHHQDQKYANQDAQQQDQYEQAYQQGQADAMQQQQQQSAPPPPAPAPAAEDVSAQLQQLAQMHNAGVLTDEEFAAAKAKLLGG